MKLAWQFSRRSGVIVVRASRVEHPDGDSLACVRDANRPFQVSVDALSTAVDMQILREARQGLSDGLYETLDEAVADTENRLRPPTRTPTTGGAEIDPRLQPFIQQDEGFEEEDLADIQAIAQQVLDPTNGFRMADVMAEFGQDHPVTRAVAEIVKSSTEQPEIPEETDTPSLAANLPSPPRDPTEPGALAAWFDEFKDQLGLLTGRLNRDVNAVGEDLRESFRR